jgi:hypothetical protein
VARSTRGSDYDAAAIVVLMALLMRIQSRERRPEFGRIPARVSGPQARIGSNRWAKNA